MFCKSYKVPLYSPEKPSCGKLYNDTSGYCVCAKYCAYCPPFKASIPVETVEPKPDSALVSKAEIIGVVVADGSTFVVPKSLGLQPAAPQISAVVNAYINIFFILFPYLILLS